MTERLSQMPKPEAEQFKSDRKLFLVPAFLIPPDAPGEGVVLLDRYWTEVREHVENLERTLGKVRHVYHEAIFGDGDEGMQMIDGVNPTGASFIQAMCHSEAKLEATEDRAALEESSDWQRCLSIGLMSQKVLSAAMEGFQDATSRRYEHIGSRIDETMQAEEAGALFIREDHRVQFPSDIRVFYVAPPALDALKRWIQEQMRSASSNLEQPQQDAASEAGP